MRFRLISSLLILSSLTVILACGRLTRRGERANTNTSNVINLSQEVTNEPKSKDPIFADFKKNWRQFINQSPELALPVIPVNVEQRTSWEPVVLSDCIYSNDAGGYVPQVTLVWTEASGQTPVSGVERPPTQQSQTGQVVQESKREPPRIRFDLAVHYQGFERNFYSSALPTDIQKRFTLPSNSALVGQEETLLLTGPSLFPKLVDYRLEMVREPNTNREVPKQTLVISDLSQGLSYNIRVSNLTEQRWTGNKEFVFLTPVCPRKF
jgi:hypothetical protein